MQLDEEIKSWRKMKRDRIENPRGPVGPWVSHTTVLPDGVEITWIFRSIHSDYGWRRARTEAFRRGHNKGISSPGRVENSLNRDRKLMDYRHNDKVPTRWPFGPKRWACRKQARQDRRAVKKQIRNAILSGDYDGVDNYVPPRDTWLWD